MPDVIIVGKGPAGISAALYTKRANLDTLILGKTGGALQKADRIENYYGFPEPVSGNELLGRGIANARRLGCDLREEQVVSVAWDGRYTVTTEAAVYQADAVILATGAVRNTPAIPGLREFEGCGISYCAVCDAFFYRGRDVAVLGSGEYALHEAMELLPVVGSVTLLTDGQEPGMPLPDGIRVERRRVASFAGDTVLREVRFKEGEPLPVAGVFVAVGMASSVELLKKLGTPTDGTRILVNEKMETNLPGLFAAGDCVGGLLQIAKAVSDGAVAATSAIRFLRTKQSEQ